ncbi:MAG TPA: cobalamin B12-binding domain-containing protein [Acidimicrobiales bacterium]
MTLPLRVLVAKVGLDGHDRGARVVARMLRDAGMEVIYAGLRQTPESIVETALQEDVDVVGLSMHNAAHRALAPRVVEALRSAGLDCSVVVGGVVPDSDIEFLHQRGVAAVLGPGASAEAVAEAVRSAGADRADRPPLNARSRHPPATGEDGT